jgi:hypothetical protein
MTTPKTGKLEEKLYFDIDDTHELIAYTLGVKQDGYTIVENLDPEHGEEIAHRYNSHDALETRVKVLEEALMECVAELGDISRAEGDTPHWNEGGDGYEALASARSALTEKGTS